MNCFIAGVIFYLKVFNLGDKSADPLSRSVGWRQTVGQWSANTDVLHVLPVRQMHPLGFLSSTVLLFSPGGLPWPSILRQVYWDLFCFQYQFTHYCYFTVLWVSWLQLQRIYRLISIVLAIWVSCFSFKETILSFFFLPINRMQTGDDHGSLPWGNLGFGIRENLGTHWSATPHTFSVVSSHHTVGQQLAATNLTAIRRAKLSIAFSELPRAERI